MIELDKKKNEALDANGNPVQQGPTNEQTISSESATAGGSAAPQAASGTQASTGFKNLSDYLHTNADQNFGSQVAGKVGTEVDSANQAQQNAESGFKSQVDSKKVEYNPDLVDRAIKDPSNFLYGTEYASKQQQQPEGQKTFNTGTQVGRPSLKGATLSSGLVPNLDQASAQASTPNSSRQVNTDNLNSFAKLRDAVYSGPRNLVDTPDLYTSAQQKTDRAAKVADLSKTEAGRTSLLDEYYGRPSYTAGQKNLDNLLLQNDPSARSSFQAVQQRGTPLTSNFASLKSMLGSYADQAAADTKAARDNTRKAIGINDAGEYANSGPIKDIVDAATNRASDLNTQKSDEYKTLIKDFAARRLNEQELSKAGLKTGQQLFSSGKPIDFSNYLTQAPDLDRYKAATKDEQARAAALSQLANLENTFLPNEQLAGQYDPNQFNTFDQTRLKNTIDQAKGVYDRSVSTKNYDVAGGGTVDPDTGRPHDSNYNRSVLDAIKGEQYGAWLAAKMGFSDQSPLIRYQNAINKLKEIQGGLNYNDVINPQTKYAQGAAELVPTADKLQAPMLGIGGTAHPYPSAPAPTPPPDDGNKYVYPGKVRF
jgi:hypothetical protein